MPLPVRGADEQAQSRLPPDALVPLPQPLPVARHEGELDQYSEETQSRLQAAADVLVTAIDQHIWPTASTGRVPSSSSWRSTTPTPTTASLSSSPIARFCTARRA